MIALAVTALGMIFSLARPEKVWAVVYKDITSDASVSSFGNEENIKITNTANEVTITIDETKTIDRLYIEAGTKVKIVGDKTLTVSGGNGVKFDGNNASLTISSGTLDATGITKTGSYSDTSLTIKGGTVQILTGSAQQIGGVDNILIEGGELNIHNNGTFSAINNFTNLTVTGGTVSATTSGGDAGIKGKQGELSTIEISGGTVTAITETGKAGIYGGDSSTITISGGTVTAKGKDGIHGADNSTITISGGTVTAVGTSTNGSTSENGVGIFVKRKNDLPNSGIYIKGGKVNATGSRAGIAAPILEISGGEVKAISEGTWIYDPGLTSNYGWENDGIEGDTIRITGGTVTAIAKNQVHSDDSRDGFGIHVYGGSINVPNILEIDGSKATVTAETQNNTDYGNYAIVYDKQTGDELKPDIVPAITLEEKTINRDSYEIVNILYYPESKITIPTFTVSFNSNGHGTAPSAQTVNRGEKATKPEDLTAEGYTFGGWYKEAECTTKWDFNNDTVTDSITLYAKWTENPPGTYTVTFNSNGHGTAPSAQTVESGSKATEPAALTADGYTFGGWYTEEGCENEYDFNTAVTSNITLYAKWEEKKEEEGSESIKTEGSVTLEVPVDEASKQVLNDSIQNLSKEQQEALEGKDIVFDFVTGDIDESTASEEVKSDIEKIKIYNVDEGLDLGQVFDLYLLVKDKNTKDTYGKITSTNGKVTITVTIPKSLQKEGRTFYILRIHDGKVTVVGKGSGSKVEMSTDAFSTYAIAYTDNENTNNSTVNTVSEEVSAGDSEESSSSSDSNPVNPDILMWSYDAAKYNSLCIKQEQGSLARLAFNAGMPLGYKEAFTYNLLVNGKADYSLKTGKFVLTIPEGYRKAGRSFALIGLNQAGKAVCFMDTDTSDSTLTTTLNLDGYAFMLVYKDGGASSGKTTVSTGTMTQATGTYTVRRGDTLSGIAKKLKTTVKDLTDKNNIKDKDRIKEGQVLKY